jgi:hypothetical protein
MLTVHDAASVWHVPGPASEWLLGTTRNVLGEVLRVAGGARAVYRSSRCDPYPRLAFGVRTRPRRAWALGLGVVAISIPKDRWAVSSRTVARRTRSDVPRPVTISPEQAFSRMFGPVRRA